MSVSDDELSGRVSAALEAAGDVAYSWKLEEDRLDWTGRLAAAGIELASELASGRSFTNRIHPDDLVHRQLALAAHFEGEAAFDCEYRLRDGEDGFLWVHERGRVRRYSFTLQENPQRSTQIVTETKASPAQRGAFQAWTGQPLPMLQGHP